MPWLIYTWIAVQEVANQGGLIQIKRRGHTWHESREMNMPRACSAVQEKKKLGHLLAGIAMTSWRSTERHEDFFFWKRSVSLSFLGVFFCGVSLGCVWVVFALRGLFCFASTLEDTWLFAFHQFSNSMRVEDKTFWITVRALSVQGVSQKKLAPGSLRK